MSSETLTNNVSSENELENFFNTSTVSTQEETKSIEPQSDIQLTEELPSQTQPKTELESFFSSEPIPDSNSLEGFLMSAEKPEISNLEKLEYGWDKETMVLGNLFRIGKAKVQDLFDDDKTFKDFIIENEKKRIDAFEKEHWKFDDEAKDSGIVTTGSVLSMLLDPYYLAGYLNPVSLKAMTNPISAATLNGLLVGGDVVIDNLAKTGEIDWGNVAVSSGVAAAVGGVIPIGGKVLSKYAPKLIKSEVELVKNFIDGKLAKQNNLTVPQLKKIQKAANNTEVKNASQELIKWTNNFVRPIAAETAKFKSLEKTLLDKRDLLIKIRKLKGRKKPKANVPGMLKQEPLGKQIINIRNEIIDAKKASEAAKKILIDKQSKKLDKWSELVANRNTKILEALKKDETKIDWALRSLLSATVRPLVGAGMGATGGILFGDEETDLMYWIAGGAMAGQMQKMIQRSSKFGTNLEKGKVLGIIDREWTQLTMQKVRDLMSGTSASKLNSYGGATEKISKMLFREVDSPVQEKSAIAVAEQMQRYYFRKINDITKGYTDDEIAAAVSINRGKQLTKDTPSNVEKLSKDLRSYMDEFKDLYNSSGFFSKKEIQDYFPRLLNYDVIKKDEKAFLKTVEGIYRSLKYKDPKKAAERYYQGHTAGEDTVLNGSVLKEILAGKDKLTNRNFIKTPVSDHIEKERTLVGPYKLVEEVLEKKGYLVNDARSILSNVVNDSVKSIAFARQFGTNGELLTPLMQQIKTKYLNSNLAKEKATSAAAQEIKLVSDSIDAYFDRYGKAMTGAAKSSASILATLGNLNMLGRVTISSLGDIVQPFQNSANWRSVVKGFKDTALTNRRETGAAKALNQDIDNAIASSLERSAGFEGKNIMLNAGWVGKTPTQKVNNIMFKALGLQWLTGYARRFAYNTAVADAHYLSKTLSKLASKGNLEKRQAKQIIYFLENNYGVKTNQALQIGKFKNLDDALKVSNNKKILNQTGVIGANRDALIPQVSNRLLFTQSNNQWVRLMGQFLSWAMAKSAQTNKILARMENGNAKTLVKTLAVLPIYSGVQSLREIAKYGEVITDYDANNNRWWSEGARLSGMFGYLPELVANRFIGPGSREPWFLFPPAAQIASVPVEAGQAAWNGNTDRAVRIINERLLPLPNWRRNIVKIFGSPLKELKTSSSGTLSPFAMGGVVKRKKFSNGDAVEQAAKEVILPIVKPEKTDENSLPVMELNNTIPETVKTRIKINENDKLFKDDTSEIVHDSVEKGNKTIGYGHKLTDDEVKSGEVYGYKISTLTKEQAEDIFNRDLEVARGDVDSLIDKDTTDPKAYGVLIEMAHQIGGTKLPKFKKMLEAVNRKDYKEAAKQMLFNYDDEGNKIGKTNWNKQTGNRAKSLAALMSSITFDRIEKNIGGIVGKAIAKGLSKAAVKRGDTAISTTVGTYKKVNKIFDDANVKTVHDFGSGLGLGSKEFTNKIVTNHEPFVPVEKIIKVKGKVPDYKTADDVIFKEGFASKDGVVNANVLNVIEDPIERANVVRQISQLISNKGMAVITTRGNEVTKAAQASKNATPFNDGWIFGKGDKKTFQKGYSQKELEEYIKSILGDKFKVEKIPSKYKIGTSGVIIKKIKGDK
jgi:GH24 family phage-related lysozyme (muramidase)